MKKLPVGVYVVAQDFEEKSGEVVFSFKGEEYTAQMGENAFSTMDDLTYMTLEKPQEPFCGYGDVPVVLIPAGKLLLGNAAEKERRFNTFMPCAVAILGENAGISPNGADLRTPAERQTESVLQGSFYFGCINIGGDKPGVLTLDGVTYRGKICDSRTGGEHAGLTVKNTIIQSANPYNLISATSAFEGNRLLSVVDCRVDGLNSIAGEGCLVMAGKGSVLVERLYMTNTAKFLGMTNYAHAQVNDVDKVIIRDSLFENCGSTHGLTVNLPPQSKASILVEGCRFENFVPEDDSVITAILPAGSSLTVKNTRMVGRSVAPAILVDGEMNGVTLENVTQEGFSALAEQKPVRRTLPEAERVYPVCDPHTPTNGDFTALDRLYKGRNIYYGDFHCHSASGGTSDGKAPIETFVEEMKKKQLDFAAIVDHRQMRHFFLPCWDEEYLICGSEPSQKLDEPSRPLLAQKMDYTMIFPDKEGLKKVMEHFREFGFVGDALSGTFKYAGFTAERFRELAEYIYGIGGLLSHAHPKQLMVSEDPLDYYFGDHVPLETVHVDPKAFASRQNRELWVSLLKLGKRVRTHGSSDSHGPVSNRGVTAVYAPRHHSKDIFQVVRSGDCTAGGVAIRMCIDDAVMGSSLAYRPGQTLLVSVDDFHPAHLQPDTVYCLKVYTERGLAYAREFDGSAQKLALPVEKRSYYRVEITDESDDDLVALSNPIWLD